MGNLASIKVLPGVDIFEGGQTSQCGGISSRFLENYGPVPAVIFPSGIPIPEMASTESVYPDYSGLKPAAFPNYPFAVSNPPSTGFPLVDCPAFPQAYFANTWNDFIAAKLAQLTPNHPLTTNPPPMTPCGNRRNVLCRDHNDYVSMIKELKSVLVKKRREEEELQSLAMELMKSALKQGNDPKATDKECLDTVVMGKEKKIDSSKKRCNVTDLERKNLILTLENRILYQMVLRAKSHPPQTQPCCCPVPVPMEPRQCPLCGEPRKYKCNAVDNQDRTKDPRRCDRKNIRMQAVPTNTSPVYASGAYDYIYRTQNSAPYIYYKPLDKSQPPSDKKISASIYQELESELRGGAANKVKSDVCNMNASPKQGNKTIQGSSPTEKDCSSEGLHYEYTPASKTLTVKSPQSNECLSFPEDGGPLQVRAGHRVAYIPSKKHLQEIIDGSPFFIRNEAICHTPSCSSLLADMNALTDALRNKQICIEENIPCPGEESQRTAKKRATLNSLRVEPPLPVKKKGFRRFLPCI